MTALSVQVWKTMEPCRVFPLIIAKKPFNHMNDSAVMFLRIMQDRSSALVIMSTYLRRYICFPDMTHNMTKRSKAVSAMWVNVTALEFKPA